MCVGGKETRDVSARGWVRIPLCAPVIIATAYSGFGGVVTVAVMFVFCVGGLSLGFQVFLVLRVKGVCSGRGGFRFPLNGVGFAV